MMNASMQLMQGCVNNNRNLRKEMPDQGRKGDREGGTKGGHKEKMQEGEERREQQKENKLKLGNGQLEVQNRPRERCTPDKG